MRLRNKILGTDCTEDTDATAQYLKLKTVYFCAFSVFRAYTSYVLIETPWYDVSTKNENTQYMILWKITSSTQSTTPTCSPA